MKVVIKNISPVLFACIMLVALSVIALVPIDSILLKMSLSNFQSEYIGLTLKMAFIFIVSYRIIKNLKIDSITGLSSSYGWTFKYLNSIPIYLMILGILSSISKDLTQVHLGNVLLLLLACLTVGFAEEFLFRGLLQSLFLKKYCSRKNGILIGTLIPAIIFGLFHLINLTQNDNVIAVLIQVVFATFIGFFFGTIALKTNKLIPLAITHGLINFFFSLAFLPSLHIVEETGTSIAPIILSLPLFIIGLLVLKKIKKEDVIKKLTESFN
jgi:membrane protease YdiL (CAAX protease family)